AARPPHRHRRRLQPVRLRAAHLEARRRLLQRERPAPRRPGGGVLMLKIWGRTNSVNVKKALWCVEELGLKYERVDAGMQFGVTKTPEYLKMNPNSLVPTISDDGFILWESHTIVRYLCAKHAAGTLYPTDLRARADAERWMDWAFTFQRAVRDVFWGLIRTPADRRDLKTIDAGRVQTEKLLP